MERFCSKCGTLVSGDGAFCPKCGAPMESAVDLSKPVNSMPTASAPVQSAPAPTYQQTAYQQSSYQQAPYQQPAQSYPQYPGTPAVNNEVMSVGQWVGTIILSGLGIIGLVLLFVWGFSNDTPITKKNYARAMLILTAIGVGIYILLMIIMFALGVGLADAFGRNY